MRRRLRIPLIYMAVTVVWVIAVAVIVVVIDTVIR